MRRMIVYSIALFIFLFAIFIFYLEEGSKTYVCEVEKRSCYLKVCDTQYYPIDQNKIKKINELIELKNADIEPSRIQLMEAITIAPYSDMEGVNGVFCNNSIFVRDNLSYEGQLFVARHELSHAFQSALLGESCTNNESCATINSAISYPMGFIETVISSLVISFNDSTDKQCFLFGSWKIFRYYILP